MFSKVAFARQAVLFFKVLTVGGEEHEIRDDEVDAWIDNAMAAGKR